MFTSPSFHLHVFRIEGAETFWYIAESASAARARFKNDPQWHGEDVENMTIRQQAEKDILGIRDDDGKLLDFTAREWCSLNGPGYLCSTVY